MKKSLVVIGILLMPCMISQAQTCDCKSNYEWVKKTFEENDAGFQYALNNKGEQAYYEHNKKTLEKVMQVNKVSDCIPVLYDWLKFFRAGHIALGPIESSQSSAATKTEESYTNWETYPMKKEALLAYLDKKKDLSYEGIWETGSYQIGIKKEGDSYLGFIIESGVNTWKKGQVKLNIKKTGSGIHSVFYRRNHSAVISNKVSLIGKKYLQIGEFTLKRIYPKMEDDTTYSLYIKSISSENCFLEKINASTIYLRVPSFDTHYKKEIDSVITANKKLLLSTKNLIIDIRNNGGGSDDSYSSIIPFLYTNPIRIPAVEFLSTELNNQRMLDFVNKPEYGFSEEDKKWAKTSYDTLQKHLGQFINLENELVSLDKMDTIYPYPEQVGIIINEANGSTAEQFLLEARQSKKVKLFGVSTFGVLDISNMYFVESPCKDIMLGYCLSRSTRIPDFTIDSKGIQPDYYMDKSIPLEEWTGFVNGILNQH